jgi:hypothetical protein
MNAKEHFEKMGFTEWVDALSEVDSHTQVNLSGNCWKSIDLLQNRAYALPAKYLPDYNALLFDFFVEDDHPSLWLSLNDTDGSPDGLPNIFVTDVDVIKEVIRSMSAHYSLFFISPASSMRLIDDKTKEHLPLSFALESLNRWIQSSDSPNSTIVFIDEEIADGKSDARQFLQRFCERVLR